MTAKGGQLVLHDKASVRARRWRPTGRVTTSFKADRDGFYRIELDAPTGERCHGLAAIHDRRADRSVTRRVSISKPGRDTTASPIEEVFVEASAEDDFGVKRSRAGLLGQRRRQKSLRLFDGKSRLPEVTAGHTFYLEELDVTAG